MADSSDSQQRNLRVIETAKGAGLRIEYTRTEKLVAFGLMSYLFLIFLAALLLILDVWTEKFYIIEWLGLELPTDENAPALLQLVVYALAGGWLGGVISAARSLQEHYTAPVEYLNDLKRQEEKRFHTSWWTRWFWGPWQGMGLSLIVLALIRSGVLVFAATPAEATSGTITESFATFGLGALVGIGAKDVIEKLNQTLKQWLKVEEPEARKLKIVPEEPQTVEYGGKPIKFTVEPTIQVTWSIDPSGVDIGSIINGIFRPAENAPRSGPKERSVVITATSTEDAARSASTILTLKTK